jgi:hypothetical protein
MTMQTALTYAAFAALALGYVGLMNWLGGEKHLFFNAARRDLAALRVRR